MLHQREVGTSERSETGRSERPRSHLSYFKRSLKSELRYARIAWDLKLPSFRPRRGAAKAGLAYEAKVLKQLHIAYPSRLLSQAPFQFDEGGGRKVAIPDALLLSPQGDEVAVIEIKIRHTADAFHQLYDFYVPIVHRAFGRAMRVVGLEICKSYDPLVKLPRPPAHLYSVSEVFEVREGLHPVLTWSRFDGRMA